ncbi:MAG: DUF349 domain-containing protein [Candidatus Amulumruptor caecigallinarius]|nr:DUF349 domain-containing protein [Candidatus Amulumruptor caecigallinarius]MCM1396992.1 DUF349 domain-containing protein [Candidatus Amulumruptor caecigallinarius]MCM1454650.1 DUF349 domain-containing protein [bacterium]
MSLPEKPQEELSQPVDGLTPAPAEAPSEAAEPAAIPSESTPVEAAEDTRTPAPATRAEVVERLEALAALPADEIATDDVTRLKLQYYSLHNGWLQTVRDEWVAQGNTPEEFDIPLDEFEPRFKELMTAIKEKKAVAREEKERREAENLTAKKQIIAQILELAADTDNVNRHYQTAKELQARFKEIGEVPPQAVADIWKQYQDAVEHYYDQLKINMELRDYDFKKNLTDKQELIAKAKTLAEEGDVVAAFRSLQTLHDKWRLIGPVAKELREAIWAEFKDASAVVNKRYQEFFEARKAREQENEAAKTAICERVEAIDIEAPQSYAAWDALTKDVLAAQEEWKKLGFASRKVNNQLFARFRAACDRFFTAKATFFKNMKDELSENLRRKTALAERAEELSASTEWRKATDELVRLQQEWKQIGPVAKKHSDAIWKRFHDACDRFFDAKKEATGGQRAAELANLKAKQELISRLEAITAEMPREEAIARLKEVQAEWPAIGHVPFKEKDKVYDTYRALCDKLYRELDIRGNGARMAAFTRNVEELGSDAQKLSRERERLARAYEARRSELQTYENNLGFLSSKSKSGDKLVRDMEHRIERLREDLAQLRDKIKLLDSKL